MHVRTALRRWRAGYYKRLLTALELKGILTSIPTMHTLIPHSPTLRIFFTRVFQDSQSGKPWQISCTQLTEEPEGFLAAIVRRLILKRPIFYKPQQTSSIKSTT